MFSVGCTCHSGDNEVLENLDRGILIKTKEMLNDMHKGKIDLDDEIFIIYVEGYIESNSKPETEYAIATEKAIKYLEESQK